MILNEMEKEMLKKVKDAAFLVKNDADKIKMAAEEIVSLDQKIEKLLAKCKCLELDFPDLILKNNPDFKQWREKYGSEGLGFTIDPEGNALVMPPPTSLLGRPVYPVRAQRP